MRLLLLLVLVSCVHKAPVTKIIEVREVRLICPDLGDPPDKVRVVGFPTSETIFVSKSDLEAFLAYQEKDYEWNMSLKKCLSE